jgi:hypothetical protein
MDNASWHHSEKVIQMCRDAGVILEFLSPYSPDFNPIEEHFGVLKKFIKKKWHENEDFISREFKMFLEWCVDVVGSDTHITFVTQEYPLHSLPNKSNRNKQIEPRNVLVLQISFSSLKNFLMLLTNCSAMPGGTLSFIIRSATTFGCCRIVFSSRN